MLFARAVGASAVLALAVISGGVGVAGPASAASVWQEIRDEKFSGAGLPKGCQPYQGVYAAGASNWAKDDVRLVDGELRLRLQARASSGKKYTSGGIGCYDWAQNYGRYEIRAVVPAGAGLDSFIALWPQKASGAENGWTGVEIAAPATQVAYVTNGYGKGNFGTQVPGSYAGLHTYTIEWAPDRTRVLVDGQEITTDARSYTGKRWLGLSLTTGEELSGAPTASTKLPAEFRIDSVRVWKYTGKAKAAAPAAQPSASANPTVPGSVVLKTPSAAAAASTEKPSTPRPDMRLAAFAVVGAMVAAGIGFAVIRFFIRRHP